METRGVRLLSLDGGGVRGLSSLLILEQLMRDVADDATSPPRPCDYFDMIGGTSTGGLIAIMLGRLGMTVDECISAYIVFAGEVFEKKKSRINMRGKVQPMFDSKKFERLLKNIITGQGLDPEEPLKVTGEHRCRVFVCATSNSVNQHTVCLSTHETRRLRPHIYNSTTIWQACRATSAAPTFFDPVEIGPLKEKFVDGGLRRNNPITELWTEASEVWPEKMQEGLACLVSIGTGVPALTPVGDYPLELVRTLKAIATDTEQTAQDFQRKHEEDGKKNLYFRFNVHGMDMIQLQESKMMGTISAATSHYLTFPDTRNRLGMCKKQLVSMGMGHRESESVLVPQVMGLVEEAQASSSRAWHTSAVNRVHEPFQQPR